jgi:hypothetical protein
MASDSSRRLEASDNCLVPGEASSSAFLTALGWLQGVDAPGLAVARRAAAAAVVGACQRSFVTESFASGGAAIDCLLRHRELFVVCELALL